MHFNLLLVLSFATVSYGTSLGQHSLSLEDKSIPRYMLRLYQEINDGLKDGKCGFNTVRNLPNLGEPVTCQEYQLQFNLSSIPHDGDSTLEAARIHLELNKDIPDDHLASSFFANSNFRLHMGLGALKGSQISCKIEPQPGTRDIIFDISDVVEKAQQTHLHFLNLTLIIENEPALRACPPNAINFEAMLEIETSSFLVQANCEIEQEENLKRRKRSIRPSPNQSESYNEGSCKRFPLSINFKEIGWDDWIIQPPTFNAYYCAGTCVFPIKPQVNASNHAVVQSLLHLFQPKSVPPSCCAPSKLVPMSMMYYDGSNSLVIKAKENMVVAECGCQ